MLSLETQLNQALDLLKIKDAEIVSLKRAIHAKQITIANIQRDWQLKEANLSPGAVTRLHAAFATSTDNAGLKQAIHVEKRKAGVP